MHLFSDSTKLATHPLNETKSTANRQKKKAKNTKKAKLKSLGTDENVTVLHALGRVFNPKYQDSDSVHKTFTHCPNNISSLLATQPTISLNLIHHNYLGHFQCLEETCAAIDCLSCSDVILNEWRSDSSAEIGTNLAVRGIMATNDHPVTGRWMPIKSAKNQLKS